MSSVKAHRRQRRLPLAVSLLIAVSCDVDAFGNGQHVIPAPTASHVVRPARSSLIRNAPRSTDAPIYVSSKRKKTFMQNGGDDTCLVGENVVDQCDDLSISAGGGGTESQSSAAINLAKCICGAGSFALPHVFLEEGVLGGTLAIGLCGALATITMRSLSDSKLKASQVGEQPIASYVQLARTALGEPAAKVVFFLTMFASLGVCSTYLVFIGSTLESMSCDVAADNIVRSLAPNVDELSWEVAAALVLLPLSLIRDYSIFAFTSTLGVIAVLGGIITTLAYGVLVDPGGGLSVAIDAVETLPLWPSSVADAFGGSFGTLCYLFAINFLCFPVMNSLKIPKDFDGAIEKAVTGVLVVNILFAVLALGFYGNETKDIVLGNLENGPWLSALKLLLCIDLMFTYPIVFSSGRQILENAIIGPENISDSGDDNDDSLLARAGIVAGGVGATFALAQIGGFGVVANLVGGVAQGTLAFIMPPAIALALMEEGKEEDKTERIAQYIFVGSFGTAVVGAVTYFTLSS